jgi:ABC-type phosphate transport system substrate-binding protein
MKVKFTAVHVTALCFFVCCITLCSVQVVLVRGDGDGDHHHLGETLLLHGSGTSNPSKCYWTILEQMMEQSPLNIHATYRGIGSSNGMEEFAYNLVNDNIHIEVFPYYFGSGDIPLRSDLYNQINNNTSTPPRMVHIPVLAGTVSFFHSVPNVPNLNLTPCVLAQIYTQRITDWNDDAIRQLNPDFDVATSFNTTTSSSSSSFPITVIRRAEGSSSTYAVTNVRSVNQICSFRLILSLSVPYFYIY